MANKKPRDDKSLLQKLGLKKVKQSKDSQSKTGGKYDPYLNTYKQKQSNKPEKKSSSSSKGNWFKPNQEASAKSKSKWYKGEKETEPKAKSKSKWYRSGKESSISAEMQGGKLTKDDFDVIQSVKSDPNRPMTTTGYANLLADLNLGNNRNQGINLVVHQTESKSKKSARKRGRSKYRKNRKSLASTKPVTENDALSVQTDLNILSYYIMRQKLLEQQARAFKERNLTPPKKTTKILPAKKVSRKAIPKPQKQVQQISSYALSVPRSAKPDKKAKTRMLSSKYNPRPSNEDLDLSDYR